MMKYEEPQKITALGVVIFSFIAIISAILIAAAFGMLSSFLVLKTNLSENFLKAGSVIGGSLGLVFASAFLTKAGKIKGIISAIIIAVSMILIKIAGNAVMNLGGYFSLNGMIGMLFILIFSFVGSVLGTAIKKR